MKLYEITQSLRNEIETFPFKKKNFTYDSSTLDFQNKSGIKVCQFYKMPDNLSVETIYHYISSVLRALDTRKIKKKEADDRIKYVYNEIEKLNPILKRARNSNVQKDYSHILTAALSLFNIDDIISFVKDEKTGRYYMNRPDWDERYNKINEIETLTNANIYWIMCDKTLDRVYKEVCKKYKKNIS